ncbi:MAG: DUF3445 domain-containing protein [Rhodospirillaceae bacterium]|nr:DUF3445 domain-containing protein [Rhodospirillaceae bacterium]
MTAYDHPATIGLKAAGLETWLARLPGDAGQLAQRARLIAERRDDVMAFLPTAESALRELTGHLAARDGLAFPDAPLAALSALGRTYAEDICILTPEGEQFILSAAVLCFPNRWKLADKVGKRVIAVHGPVPDYAEKLSNQVDFFLSRLRPLRCFRRANWGLASNGELHLPTPLPPVDPTTDQDFFVRREEQAFVKLPESEAVIFTIRASVTPWAQVPEADRAEILVQTARLSPAWRNYKSIRSAIAGSAGG